MRTYNRTPEFKIGRAKQAFMKRKGEKSMTLTAERFTHERGGQCVRITDTQTGNWMEFNISGWRIVFMKEYNSTN